MVGDLSLLAVASAASPVVFPSSSKDLYGVLPFQGKRPQDPAAVAALQFSAPPQHQHQHLEGMPQALQMVVPGHQGPAAAYQAFAFPDKAALVDVQDCDHDSVRLSLGIAEQCAREEKFVKLLTSLPDVKDLDASLLAEVVGQQTLTINLGTQPYIPDDKLSICEFGLGGQPYIPDDKLSICEFGLDEQQQYLPEKQLVIPDPLIDIARSFGSALTIDQNGRVLFVGSGVEMRDLLSVLLEFNMSRREVTGCKAALLVPYFDRKRLARANSHASSSKLASAVTDTLKSADAKSKSSSKKKQKSKSIKERDLYQKNYVHASEAFLSILMDKDRSSSTILCLKKAGPEITELLTQCSIGIAGTGLAVLLSVVCKMATGMRTPYASSRLLSTSVGFGLFWLSWAVNGLRDTIASISRSPGNMNLEEDEIVVRIQKSTNEILFRAITLLAITALKFA